METLPWIGVPEHASQSRLIAGEALEPLDTWRCDSSAGANNDVLFIAGVKTVEMVL